MKPDLERYRPYLTGQTLTKEEEDDLIHSLWRALERLVDREFGLDSVSLAKPPGAVSDSFASAHRIGCAHDRAQSSPPVGEPE